MHYTDPNYNPLLDPVEEDYRKRVDQFVRDLAWGVLRGYWLPQLDLMAGIRDPEKPHLILTGYVPKYDTDSPEIKKQWYAKWQAKIVPSQQDLWFWGYVTKADNMLTSKALELLDAPSSAPKVFISYRHITSSTLALAIEARLKYAGNNNIFIDKELNPGERFETQIKDAIIDCDYFVLLVDKEVFKPGYKGISWVKAEYNLALEHKKKVLAIVHYDALEYLDSLETDGFDTEIHFIDCKGIAAFDYETAINRLLNTIGYATY